MLQGAGGVTAVMLAGCGSNDQDVTPVNGGGDGGDGGGDGGGGDGGGDGGGTSGGNMPEFHTFLPGAIESQSQIGNPWGQSANYHALAWAVHPHLARWSTSAEFNKETTQTYNQFIETGVESLDIDRDGGTITMKLFDDWQWTSGDEVTADDVVLNLKINKQLGYDTVLWANMDRIYADGEKTAVIELGQLNTDYAAKQLFTQDFHLNPPREVNGEETEFVSFLQRLEDASSEEEINSIDQELTEFQDFPIDETVTCGPWEIASSTETVAELVPNEGYHTDVNFSGRIENFDAAGGRAQPISAFLSGDIEAGPLPQPEHIERIQSDDSKEVVIRAGTAVQGFALNWNTSAEDVPEIYANPKFRQAIAYVLDNEGIGRAHPTRTTALERADGVFFNVEEALPNIHDQLRTYEVDHEKATSMLQDLGFSKENGTWQYDGETFTIDHISPNYHHWPTTGQATMSQLNQFGFETSFSVNENFGSILWGRSDDTWDSLRTHASALTPVSYMSTMFEENSMVHFPATVEVPMPVGDWEGSTEEVNVREEVNGLAQLTGEEYTKQLERLAWIYNYTLPSIPTNVENWGMMYSTSDWSWPAKDDPLWGINFTNRSFMSIPAMSPK
ncbi:ABC transporter substrate-binding protein [Halosimplex aquaticum]|uniref:ABC transporter substrate-binding protein n=1 Tax=Halosimplex aquaticum TaxID=3026162 RepID=A0ABD5Y2B2_9EURY|nr:ABC transporter substrate-binding protein [Halosimplex aquaticum]